MRAARVLDMLLVLQRRGKMTARDLAELLEVSERTVLRDVEALSEAGAPIFTTRGSGGGIELMDGFQTRLTGLTTDEATSLFLVGTLDVARRLGLGASTLTARNKLLNALPPALADEAESLTSWFVHDPEMRESAIPTDALARIARCVREHRVLQISLGADPPITVHPLGLVLKTGSWYLVHLLLDNDDVGPPLVTSRCLDDLGSTQITNRRFNRLADFDLGRWWRDEVDSPRSHTPARQPPARPHAGRRRRATGSAS